MRRLLLMLGLLAAPAVLAQPYVAGAPEPFAPEGFAHAVVSPTGDRVMLTTSAYEGVWVTDANGGDAPRQLSAALGAGFGAVWSPDGQSLAVRAAQPSADGSRVLRIALLDAETGAETALVPPTYDALPLPRFAPDGASVLLATDDGVRALPTGKIPTAASGSAVLMGADGQVVRAVDDAPAAFALPVRNARALRVVPSPDGQRVAIEIYGGDLYLANADGSNPVSLGRGEAPTWRPDGRYVAFMVTRDDGHELLGSDLVVARADGQQRAQLTRTDATMEMYPAWLANDALLYDDAETGRVMRLPLADR